MGSHPLCRGLLLVRDVFTVVVVLTPPDILPFQVTGIDKDTPVLLSCRTST